ncbi:hypothetical protein [Paraburkholderia panacisoli]|nr:hypothetical protein [Paraburkholderia panacisoli]
MERQINSSAGGAGPSMSRVLDRGDGVGLAPVQFVHAKQVVLDVTAALA